MHGVLLHVHVHGSVQCMRAFVMSPNL